MRQRSNSQEQFKRSNALLIQIVARYLRDKTRKPGKAPMPA
jgi:hypothetical protein